MWLRFWQLADSERLKAKEHSPLRLQWNPMIRNVIVPRVLGKTQEDLQPALELLRALGRHPATSGTRVEPMDFNSKPRAAPWN